MAQDLTAQSVPAVESPNPGPHELARHLLRSGEWYKSGSMAYTDTTSVNLLELPGNCLIVDLLVRVTTAFEASGDGASAANMQITAPNDTGTEILWDAAETQLQATGFYLATTMALTPASGGYLIAAYVPGTTTAGACEVYVEIVRLEDRLVL